MAFLEFWKHNLTDSEVKAIKTIEQQILALDNEWMKYEKKNFVDWNVKFSGLPLHRFTPAMQIPMRDAKVEKKEFEELWRRTTKTFSESISLIEKGKTQNAIMLLFSRIRDLEARITELENEERRTITYIRNHDQLFRQIFDNNYGEGFFDKEVLENYEIRFRILEILKHEYELIKYLLSDTV